MSVPSRFLTLTSSPFSFIVFLDFIMILSLAIKFVPTLSILTYDTSVILPSFTMFDTTFFSFSLYKLSAAPPVNKFELLELFYSITCSTTGFMYMLFA